MDKKKGTKSDANKSDPKDETKKEEIQPTFKTEDGVFYTKEYLDTLTNVELLNLMVKESSLQHTMNIVRQPKQ